ncbi:redoxin family protein [Leucobacter sp. USHLN153]|uniref:redoxin family protein n=1 Tax=Leucobacter sp. USHLN153 TaxID=3081268 RepID=UPI0030189CF9
MRIGELVALTGASVKAIRYYEQLGLIAPARKDNGYRSFDDHDARAVSEIRELASLGVSPQQAAPFLECLGLGHDRGDDCVSSLSVYRDTIANLDRMIGSLSERRIELQRRLNESAERTFTQRSNMTDFTLLPEGLPVPDDDGAAGHLPGMHLPNLVLPTSDGRRVSFDALGPGRTVVYLYPLTGKPGVDLPEGWDAIPGARGCSTEACDFSNHFDQLRQAGAQRVYGMSSQSPEYQDEVVQRLQLPFTMISDESLAVADALKLPTFAAPGHERLYSRLTLIVRDGEIEHAFYPIFPPNTHAQQVLAWLEQHPA